MVVSDITKTFSNVELCITSINLPLIVLNYATVTRYLPITDDALTELYLRNEVFLFPAKFS